MFLNIQTNKTYKLCNFSQDFISPFLLKIGITIDLIELVGTSSPFQILFKQLIIKYNNIKRERIAPITNKFDNPRTDDREYAILVFLS